jgi:hypothetical protein
MNARIFTTTVLMIIALTTFAQTSRRAEREKAKSTKTEENRTESRRSPKNENKQSDSNKPADNKQESINQRGTSGNTNTQQRTETNKNQNNNANYSYDKQNNHSYQPGDSRRDNRNNNQGNNNSYRPGDGRRDNHDNRDNRGGFSPQRRSNREYVQINHSPRRAVVVDNRSRSYRPTPVEVRREYHPYRVPAHREVVWSIEFRNNFRVFYPEVRYWRYDVGYRLPEISAYDAFNYVGEVANVYGRVFDVYYEPATDDYYLYFGDYYPYHDLSVIVPGREARSINRQPERFFQKAYIVVNGYITQFDDKPEIVVRSARQIELY